METLPLDAGIEPLMGEEETSMVEVGAIVLKRAGLRMLLEGTGDETGAEEEEVLGSMRLEFVPLGTVGVSSGNEEAVLDVITASTAVDEVNEVVSTTTD
jgi:hypothetical protein